MKTTRFSLLAALLPLFALLLILPACSEDDDNPVDAGETEHTEAFGARLLLGETVLAEADGSEVTGSLELTAGVTTELITVQFLDEDGDWFDPADHDHEAAPAEENEDHDSELALVIADTDIATFTLGEDIAEATTHWSLTLTGVDAGATTLTVKILHEGHDDYVSPTFPITVVEP
ncbi:hypothetical protein KQI52_13535 [bacterium]|nr:hypothetical protein [bacterium]